MDDLSLLRETRPDHPLCGVEEMAEAHRPLLVAMVTAPADRPRWIRQRRIRWAGVTLTGLTGLATAAVAGTLLLAPGAGPAPHHGSTAPRLLNAAEVLHSASQAALTEPAAPPRPDQYVYTKTSSPDLDSPRESWMSADGTHDGLIVQSQGKILDRIALPGCRNGRVAEVSKDGKILSDKTDACTPKPVYRADLPTDPDAMLAYLTEHNTNKGSANSLAKDVFSLIDEAYLTPAQRSALFQAASKMDGLSVVRDATDGAGRHGIGVAWTDHGVRTVIVFDGKSFNLLGTDRTAILTTTVVDKVGQRG